VSGPHWLADTFAALLLGTAAYCVGRLVMARMRLRAVEHDVDMVHVVMGIAMAGMLVPAIDPVGNRSWEVVFVAAMAWFTWRAFREVQVHRAARPARSAVGHHLVHAVTCGAMVYMLVVLAAVSSRASAPGPFLAGMGGAGASGHPLGSPPLAAVLAVFLLGYAVWCADRLTLVVGGGPRGAMPGLSGPGPERAVLAPRLSVCCQIFMCFAMGYMLVAML
jgi:hypothetical protein